MVRQNKVVVSDKVQRNSNRNFRIKKEKIYELDLDVEVEEDGEYVVEKLSVDGLPTHMQDGNTIHWFNNFAIKRNGQYINQPFKVKVPGISDLGNSRLVIYDGNGDPYYYTGAVSDDTFELTDGDPAVGQAP